jgi:hypothetical protein
MAKAVWEPFHGLIPAKPKGNLGGFTNRPATFLLGQFEERAAVTTLHRRFNNREFLGRLRLGMACYRESLAHGAAVRSRMAVSA